MASWKDVVGAVAPGLATILGGPLAGGVVSVLTEKLLGGSSGDPVQDEAKIAGILAGPMTPELRAKIVEAETTFKIEAMKVGLEEKRIEADTERAYLADVQQARATHTEMQTSEHAPWYIKARQSILALVAVLGFMASIGALLWMTANSVAIDTSVKDVLIYALGTLTGVVLMVYNYDFGTSDGSRRKDTAIADALKKQR